jgi:hypothetical protein
MIPSGKYPDLISPILELRQRESKIHPCTTNRASALGGECERQLVYARTRWAEATPAEMGLLQIWHQGVIAEEAIVDDLRRAGVAIVEQQCALEWRECQITGHIDFAVECDGQLLPADVKSMAPHLWRGIFKRGQGQYSWDEVAEALGKKPWQRKYRAQIILYCLMRCVDRGLLLCVDKSSGSMGQVNIPVDYGYAEELLCRAERVNGHVREKTLPDRIPTTAETCEPCAYRHLCLPDYVRCSPETLCHDEEVVAWLERIRELEVGAEEHDALVARVRAWALAREGDSIRVGRWSLTKRKSGKGVTVGWGVAT